jgi:predicted permease
MIAKPPRVARWLLGAVLPARDRRVILDDLEADCERRLAAGGSRLGARAYYWAQALRSLPSAWRLRRSAGRPRRSWRPHAELAQDVRYAVRRLRREPAFALAVLMTLGGGVAVTAASASVAHAVLLRPLPYESPDRLVRVAEFDRRRDASSGNVSWPDFLDYQARSASLQALAGHTGGSRTLTGAGAADRVTMAEVTTNFFDVLGVRPAVGRLFGPGDAVPQSAPVVVLTDGAWRRRFGADPSIVGRQIRLSGQAATVIGVLPRAFVFPPRGRAEFWLPARPSLAQVERRYFHWLDAVGRLAPGVSVETAAAELSAIARDFALVDPEFHPSADARVVPFARAVTGDVRPTLILVTVASLLMLLVACANVGGLAAARAAARRREVDVRAALGAGRFRLARQFLAEGLVLGMPAIAAGVAAGQWLLVWFVGSMPEAQRLALPHLGNPSLDPRVTLAIGAGALAASALAGMVPLTGLRSRSRVGWREGIGGGRMERRLQSVVVGGQIAVAVVLLTGGVLMVRTMTRLAERSPGFDPSNVFTARVTFAGQRYQHPEAMFAFHDDLLRRVRALPGVRAAATIDQAPLSGQGNSGTFRIRGDATEASHETKVRTASAGYFGAIGLAFEAGRPFARTGGAGGPLEVVVNRALADRVFGGRAIGARISFPFFDGQPDWEIVGVVGDEQVDQIDSEMSSIVYFDYARSPENGFTLVIRTSDDPAAVQAPLRALVASLDPDAPVFAERTLEDALSTSVAVYRRRIVLGLVGTFATASLALAMVGLFGSVARGVAARTREIGIRLTLGASRRSVMGGVLRRVAATAAGGLAVGLAGAVLFARALSGLLFGVVPGDPSTYALVAALLLAAIAAACAMPVRRAIRIDPAAALRAD